MQKKQTLQKKFRTDQQETQRDALTHPFFVTVMSQSPGLPETLPTVYNPGTCHLALPVLLVVTVNRKI